MNTLHYRIIEISKKLHLSHVGSCLTAVDIISEIYTAKKKDEKFVLSCGHTGLALYTVLEAQYGLDAEELFLKYGTHPRRNELDHIYCSTGSLGMGLGVSVGMALADRTKNVYCLVSDGEIFEGTTWECSNVIQKYNVTNLKVYMNYNGWSAYDAVDSHVIRNIKRILPAMEIRKTKVEDYGLNGLSAHYITL